MAEKFDVASRLAEGTPAVETVQQYVSACHDLGYAHPDLTAQAAQIRDRYHTESGMDLAVLQEDCLALEAAVRSARDAAARQDGALSSLAGSWHGDGAEGCRDFLRRHGQSSATAAAALQTAAEALAALREALWGAVDAKVDAVVTIEAGAGAFRADWLSAATTVTTGAGDRAAAAEMVDNAVKPFVDTVIRGDWVTAMQGATSSVADAYQRATVQITAEPEPVFAIPGDLGPGWNPPPATAMASQCSTPVSAAIPANGIPAPVVTVPSQWSAAAPAPPPAAPLAAPLEPVAAPPVPPMSSMVPPIPSLGGLGSGMPGLADTLGGLLGNGGSLPGDPGIDIPELDTDVDEPLDTEEPEEEPEEELEELDGDPVDEEPEETVEEASEEAIVEAEPESEPVPTPAPCPVEPPPPTEPLPPVEPPPEQTPCEIAADELPQVGEPPE